MTTWGRATPWRQGAFLADADIDQLGIRLAGNEAGNTIAIVASHDCDIANSPESEPHCEIVVGKYVDAADGNFTHNKNPRKLHLEIQSASGARIIELNAIDKRQFSKQELPDILPRADITLSPNNLIVLQRWLAIRYARAAFSDAFQDRLKIGDLHRKIGKISRKYGPSLVAIFFDVDSGVEVIREAPEDTYALDVILLHATNPDPAKAAADCEALKSNLVAAFRETHYKIGSGWTNIELKHCDVISDEALSYRQALVLKQWSLDYISLEDNPIQPMLEQR